MTRILAALGVATAVLVGFRLGLVEVGGYARFVVLPLGVLAMNFVLAFLGITGAQIIRRMVAERAQEANMVPSSGF